MLPTRSETVKARRKKSNHRGHREEQEQNRIMENREHVDSLPIVSAVLFFSVSSVVYSDQIAEIVVKCIMRSSRGRRSFTTEDTEKNQD